MRRLSRIFKKVTMDNVEQDVMSPMARIYDILKNNPIKWRDLERIAIEASYHKCGKRVTSMCRDLGLGRTTIYRKLKKIGFR